MDMQSKHIAEQAAAYFARRHDETPSLRRKREAWLAEDARHVHAYEQMQRVWEHTGKLRTNAALQALVDADLADLQKARGFRPGYLLLATAALLLVSVGVWVAHGGLVVSPPARYVTHLGEHRTEMLDDRTAIVLNTDTVVETHYSRNRRDVTLQRGEAQFDVAHDATRPFIVSTDVGTITALGTRFQVRRETDATLITLLEGKVEVAQGQERRVLRPNEQARLSMSTGIAVRTIDPALVNGWLDGWLRFRNTPLAEVVAEANRYSPRQLRLGDGKLDSFQLNGNFRAGDNLSIATAIAQILSLRVEDRGSDIVLLSK